MTLGLDARAVHRTARRGTGKNLIDLYRQVLKMRPNWRVIGYHRGPEPRPIDNDRYSARLIECPGDRFDVWRHYRLPAAARADRVNLLHCPANLVPAWIPTATLVTIHDLLPLSGPKKLAAAMDASIRRCVAKNTVIITPSQYTADELVRQFAADPQRIVVNHWAADRAMNDIKEEAQLSATAQRYGLSDWPILHLGAPDPRKNTTNAIKAYAKLPATLRKSSPLLVIGLDREAHRQQMADLCEQLNVTGDVKLHGFADEADMPALFSMASVLLYPSHGEGFGLPILDAWSAKAAVLTSNTTSLPEVGADAAIYADPQQPDQIADRLHALLRDRTLRESLVAAGSQRIKNFTWQRTAERFIGAVELASGLNKEAYRDAA